MSAKEKAEELVDSYRNILMNEDTECGNEILCTVIAKKCALIALDEIIEATKVSTYNGKENSIGWNFDLYWNQVKDEIEKL
jgi:hypothetical protein